MTILELRAKRANLINQAGELLTRAENENRDLTAEENTQFEALHREADTIKTQYERMERQQSASAGLGESQGRAAGGRPAEPQASDDEQRAAFGNWLRYGMSGLSAEHQSIIQQRMGDMSREARAQGAAVDTAGGYLISEEMVRRIETAMLPFAGIRNTRATILRTSTGADIQMPTSNDTDNSGELLGENKQVSEKDITFGSKTIRAYIFSSKLVRVPITFLQDQSIANFESWLIDRLGERIGRANGAYFIDGTGNNQPEGLAEAATLGATAASQTAIKWTELVDLQHSVNPAYRLQAEWLLADGALKEIKKLKDGEGRPLWVPGVAVKEPDTILSRPYAIDLNLATPAASSKSIFFGDFSKFYIRDVQSAQLMRLVERYADYLQVAFLLFSRHDSALLDAGTHPIKYLQQHA